MFDSHVSVNMAIKVTFLFITIRTVTTGIRFFSSLNELQVLRKIDSSTWRFFDKFSKKWLDSYMFSLMQNEIRCTTKHFITIGTFNRFAGMQGHMSFEDCVLCEFFMTNRTFIWLFSALWIKNMLGLFRIGIFR